MAVVKAEINVERIVRNAVIQVIHEMPFYGHILSQLPKKITDEVPTLAVGMLSDDSMLVSLFVSPTYVKRIYADHSDDDAFNHIVQLLKHEVLHIIFRHLFIKLPDKEAQTIAAEMSVNSYIDKNKVVEAGIYAEDYGFSSKQGILEYYNMLTAQKQNGKNQNGNDKSSVSDSSHGSNNSNVSDSSHGSNNLKDNLNNSKFKKQQNSNDKGQKKSEGGSGSQTESENKVPDTRVDKQLDSHDAWDKVKEGGASEVLLKDIVRKAKAVAKESNKWGNLPSNVKEAVDIMTEQKKPVISWQSLLRDFVASSTETTLDYTNKRCSKRFGTRPGTIKKAVLNLAVGIDTSGSVDTRDIEMFFNELYWMSKEQCDITVFECDTKIHRETPFSQFDCANVVGRGGTDLEPVFKEATERNFDALIYFTDAEAPKLKNDYSIPTMLVLNKYSWHSKLETLPCKCLYALKIHSEDNVEILR